MIKKSGAATLADRGEEHDVPHTGSTLLRELSGVLSSPALHRHSQHAYEEVPADRDPWTTEDQDRAEQAETAAQDGCSECSTEDLALKTLEETPEFLHRPYITSGYRVLYSFRACWRSLFSLHNETMNCWTHLLGFFFFLALNVYALFQTLKDAPFLDQLLFTLFLVSCQICMLCSVCFHLLGCNSTRAYTRFFKMDMVGISAQILGSSFPGIHYSFRCEAIIQGVYLGTITIGCVVGMAIPYIPWTHRPENEKWRQLFFTCLVAFGVIPFVHWSFIATSEELDAFFWSYLGMFALYTIGMIFYVTRFPERLFPGKFDIWLHSHQIWHVFVMAAAYVWLCGCLNYYKLQRNSNATCEN